MFQLKSDKKETENKTIRFPIELVKEIEEVIGEETTFLDLYCKHVDMLLIIWMNQI